MHPRAAILAALFLTALPAAAKPPVTKPSSGMLLDAPSDGDIRLKDADGHWMLVAGIPVEHPPPDRDAVRIAVIDSGVALDHPQLAGLVTATKDFTGEGMEDRIGHGTVVTILLRAAQPGSGAPAPSPDIIAAKVAHSDGSIDKKAVIAAIDWAAAQRARIVNLSLGFPATAGHYADLCAAIRRHKTVLFVAAAGNGGKSARFYPAICGTPNLISVGTPDDYSGKGDVYTNGTIQLVPAPD